MVTNNADSGPGSLRQALIDANANGSTVKDLITFNIPDLSETGRTINILISSSSRQKTSLPVPTNTDIDGSTQPGNKFGASDAKIKITVYTQDSTTVQILTVGSNTGIYGLWLAGNWAQVSSGNVSGVSVDGMAVVGSNITIGAPGKGNLIGNCLDGINIAQGSAITIQSNIIGLDKNGVTNSDNYTGIECQKAVNLTIGGDQPDEGNVLSDFATGMELISCTNVVVAHNLIGTDVTGNRSVHSSYIGTNIYSNGVFATSGGGFTITNNLFAGIGDALIFSYVTGNYTVTGNTFGTGLTTNVNLGNRHGVFIGETTGKGIILNNKFYYNNQAVFSEKSNEVTVTKNIFDCNISIYDIDYITSNVQIPDITIDSRSTGQLSGTATPNSLIELFYTGTCGCEPTTYIASVQADNAGNWNYTASLSAKWVIASATDQHGSTSLFTSPFIDESKVLIKDVTCGDSNGAVVGITYKNARDAYWTNLDDGTIIKQNDITFIPIGKYKYTITTGDCTLTSKIYEVTDKRVIVDASHTVISNAFCGLPTGSVDGIQITNHAPSFTSTWRDETGKVIGDSVKLNNARPGKYSLVITSPNGVCPQLFYFTVNTSTELVLPPAADNVLACTPGDAFITVNNPVAGYSYYLFEDESDTTPIDDQPSGKFQVDVKNNRSYYISRHKGTCESSRIKVNVTVLSTALNIANTFSPNGDGVNDTWAIGGIENYPNATIQVFTRSGEKVFESTNYAAPFNGNYQGRQLPAAAYYYIINLKAKSTCNFLSGSLTIVR